MVFAQQSPSVTADRAVPHPAERPRRVSKDDVVGAGGLSFETPASQAPEDEGSRTANLSARSLGPFKVSTDAATVARFAAATGAAGDTLATTFPIVWLSHPDIRAAIVELARPGEIAFHEEQNFDYRAPLRMDTLYALSVDVERVEAPARIVMTSTVSRDGETMLAMRTVLRLIAASAIAAQQQQAKQ